MKRTIVAVLAALSLVMTAEAATRGRAVRSSAPPCTFSLQPGFAATVTAAGLSSATLSVFASSTSCSSWNAYSLTDWVTVMRSGNAVLVDVAPNPTSTARTATILVAGIRYSFSQEGAVVVSPPIEGNVLANGGFDRDLAFWGWQDRFPNGFGSAAWSSSDAINNPNSGSIRLRNNRTEGAVGHTFQQLQCVALEASVIYSYGGKFNASSSSAGQAIFAIVEYADENCDVAAVLSENQRERIQTPGTWQSESYTKRMGPTTKSGFVVIGALASVPGTYEVLMDDVFLKKQ